MAASLNRLQLGGVTNFNSPAGWPLRNNSTNKYFICIGKSKKNGVCAYLFFAVILCTPQGGIELNVSVAKKSSSPVGRYIYIIVSI